MAMQRTGASGLEERMRQDRVRLTSWTAGWVITTGFAIIGPLLVWDAPWLSLLAILLNLGVGFGMIRANMQHLGTLDEMMRRIHLEAMAIALGVGIVVGVSYTLLAATNLIPMRAEISFLILLMSLTYCAALAVGLRRYR
jgi:hypothetical protein